MGTQRFKGIWLDIFKQFTMSGVCLFSLHFIYADRKEKDDILRVFRSTFDTDYFNVTFTTTGNDGDSRAYSTYMTESRLLRHIDTIMDSLRLDQVPFEEVQVTTPIHPIVMYHVSQLDNLDVLRTIGETAAIALRSRVRRLEVQQANEDEDEE
jgi:hypothetical protein